MELTIYTDGGCYPNPGKMGIGVVIYKDETILKKISKNLGKGTNNIAEYEALVHGLEEALKLGATTVNIFSDSDLMVNQIKGNYKVKPEHLKRLKEKALQLLNRFDSFEISHIPRERNSMANKLSVRGIFK